MKWPGSRTAKPVDGTLPRNARSSSDEPEELRVSLGEHLEELRDRIIKSVAILAVATVIGWLLQPILYEFLNELVFTNLRAVLGNELQIGEAFRNATEAFMLKLKLSFAIGLIFSAPFILLQLWGFVRPGLKPNERQPVERVAPLSFVLFAMGVGFCWLVLPATIRWFGGFLLDFPGTGLIQDPGAMVFFVLKMMLAFGIAFQLPLIVFALGAMGLLSAGTLLKYWRQSFIGIAALSAILTPSADAFSMLMLAIPMIVLFMVSVFAVKFTQKRKQLAVAEFTSESLGE